MNLTETTIKKEYLYQGKIVSLRCDEVRLPDGKHAMREILEHPGGACVICVRDGKVALVRQFRYAYGEELLEIPAGKLQRGEDPLNAAKRELEEETGLIADSLELLLTLYPSPGYCDEKIYIYEAHGTAVGRQHLDEDEFLSVVYLPVEEALEKVMRGEIKDSKTVAALLMYAKKLRIAEEKK